MTDSKKLGITDVVLRDAHQSILATRMRIDDMLPIADKLALKVDRLKNTKQLIIESVVQIQASQSPMVMKEILGPYLPGGVPADEDGGGE